MSSSEGAQVTLAVRAEDAAAEIYVVDGGYHLVGRGLGSLRTSLPAGLYKVKVRTGPNVQEEFASLEPGRAALLGDGSGATLERQGDVAVMHFPRARFATSVPLADTSRTHEYQLEAAVRHSRKVHAVRGQGSQVFVFARTWTHSRGHPDAPPPQDEEVARRWPPALKLELCDLAGRLLVDLVREGASDPSASDPWVACNVDLDPGLYRLRVRTEAAGGLERVVVASPGWQAQVFLYQRFDRGRVRSTRINPGNMSVLLRRPGEGFDPGSPELRLAELARTGLRNRRAVIPPELLDSMAGGKFDNPMLGLYGAYLLLLCREVDLGLLGKVLAALRSMLGPHPDVEALGLALGQLPTSPFLAPPMLLTGWSLIVRETIPHPGLVPNGSLAARVADRLWGEGPWLIWRAWEPPDGQATLAPATGAAPDLAELLRRLRAAGPERLGKQEELKGLERLLAESLTATARPSRKSPSRAARGLQSEPTPAGLVQALGVPMASLEDAALRLLGRLQAADGAGRG